MEENRAPPTLSVAMATYNGENHLEEQLRSLADQSRLPEELIISDDGSTDRTLEIARTFARSSPFRVEIRTEGTRLGYRGNFMRAATRCRGDLISFCDQDDVWHPRKIETVRNIMAAEPDVLLAFHNAVVTDERRNRLRSFYEHDPCPPRADPFSLSPTFFSPGFSQTLRASLLRALPHWQATPDWYDRKEPAAHDVFFFALASSLGRIAYVNAPLADYRQHAGSTFGFQHQKLTRYRHAKAFFGNSGPLLRRYGTIFDAYARIPAAFLESAADDVSRESSENSTASWSVLGDLYMLRADVRDAGSLAERVNAYGKLRSRGAYGQEAFWTFGRKAGIKDLIVGVMLGSLIARFSPVSGSEGEIRPGRARSSSRAQLVQQHATAALGTVPQNRQTGAKSGGVAGA